MCPSKIPNRSRFPALDFQYLAELDGVLFAAEFVDLLKAAEFYLHHRGIGGVAVAELDDVVLPAFESSFPVGRLPTVFDALRASGDLGEELAL